MVTLNVQISAVSLPDNGAMGVALNALKHVALKDAALTNTALTHAARESIYAVAFSTRTVDRCVYSDKPRRGVVYDILRRGIIFLPWVSFTPE